MIDTIEDASRFLHHWYGEPDGAFSLLQSVSDFRFAAPLMEFWQRNGRLFHGQQEWIRIGTPSPLACQDRLAGPSTTCLKDGLLHFIFENQGNWSMAYRVDDIAHDPQVLCNSVEYDFPGVGHVPIGAPLSQVLITSALIETVNFAIEPTRNEGVGWESECSVMLWIGSYHNAPGYYDAVPSHRFTTNPDRSLLCENSSIFVQPQIAHAETARTRWRELRAGSVQ